MCKKSTITLALQYIHDLCTCALFRVGPSRVPWWTAVGSLAARSMKLWLKGGSAAPHDPPPADCGLTCNNLGIVAWLVLTCIEVGLTCIDLGTVA